MLVLFGVPFKHLVLLLLQPSYIIYPLYYYNSREVVNRTCFKCLEASANFDSYNLSFAFTNKCVNNIDYGQYAAFSNKTKEKLVEAIHKLL